MRLLIFIPARQGSKGIKGKNFKKLNGKPIIDYTIKFSRKLIHSKKNCSIFFSSDSLKYLRYSQKKGIRFNYLRPRKFARDNSNIIDAVLHGVDWLKSNKNLFFDTILLLQPTSPFRNIKEINKAINIFKKKKINSLISVTDMEEHPYKCLKLKKNNWSFLEKKNKNIFRRQQYKNNKFDYCFIDGTFYLANLNFLRKYKSFIQEGKTKLFRLRGKRPPDIDHISDFQITELFYKKYVRF